MEKEIENLIKEYRELEEKTKNIEPILINNKMYFIDEELYEDLLKDIKTNYIPKSKIKEKIEEINSELEEKYSAEKISVFSGNTYMEKFKLLGKLQALQELMEDK